MLETFFQNPTQQTLVKYDQIVTQINDLDATFSSLSDEQLQDHTRLLRTSLQTGEKTTDQILIESFVTRSRGLISFSTKFTR